MALGIGVNVVLLAYYKYANFLIQNLSEVFAVRWEIRSPILPLGISFFTFTQIAYLVDAYRGSAREYSATRYGLFVSYFPHLIAGPVLHHKEMMPQFEDRSNYRVLGANLAAGLTYFALGLFKKTVIADGVGDFAKPIFNAAAERISLTAADAWGGVLAYTFQLYFDFSAYSDMAIGLALMMGVRLPLNFDSPYKAVNIIEFWRRWHMTLSRFLRDYVYVPLGGNRHGKVRRYVNLFATMLVGGLWHGAGWTFVLWGGLHGVYLIINHAWHAFRKKLGHDPSGPGVWWGRLLGRAVTFFAVALGWVFFRAANFESAERILSAMFSAGTWHLSPFYAEIVHNSSVDKWTRMVGVSLSSHFLLLVILLVSYALVVVAPNTQQIMAGYYSPPGMTEQRPSLKLALLQWRPSLTWAVLIAATSIWGLLHLSQVSEFLYFQF